MPFDSEGIWRPNLKQERFLAVPDTVKEALYAGGAGSGKSEILLMYGVAREWIKHSKFKQLFTRRTFPELRNEIVPRTKEIYPRFGATFNKSDMAWTFPRLDQFGGRGMTNDGAMIFLGHMENEDDARKYDSMQINLFTPDEITSYLEWQYLYVAFTRVRSSTPDLPAVIRTAGMPGGIGHNWVKKRFVDAAPNGNVIIKGRGGNKRIYIFATQEDNKKFIDPTYAASLMALPEAEKQAKLYGNWTAFEGQVFEEFRDRRYPDEPDNALHVIDEFEIPEWWPKIVIGDWGFAAMTWIGFGAISPDKKLYIYRELSFRKVKIEEWGAIVKEFIDRDNPREITFCKSAGQDRGQEHTIQQQIENALNRPVGLSNNSSGTRIAGKLLLHEYLRWKPKYTPTLEPKLYDDNHAQWILRNRGMIEYDSYLSSFSPSEPEINLPKLQIFKTCELLIGALKSCVYAKASRDGVAAEDVAEFEGDDPYDGIRYMCDATEKYFKVSANEFEVIQKRERLSNLLSKTQDWTAFYRNACSLETSDKITPIRRYHN